MNEVLIGIITLLLAVATPLVYKLHGFYKEQDIFDKVKWCVHYDSLHRESPEARMRDHIFNLQHELSLDEKYRITKGELDATNEILLYFRQDIIQKYFSGHLIPSKSTAEVSFIVTLDDCLASPQYEQKFRDNITYHKLHYISQLYCLKLYNITGKEKLGVRYAEATKETIDNMLAK